MFSQVTPNGMKKARVPIFILIVNNWMSEFSLALMIPLLLRGRHAMSQTQNSVEHWHNNNVYERFFLSIFWMKISSIAEDYYSSYLRFMARNHSTSDGSFSILFSCTCSHTYSTIVLFTRVIVYCDIRGAFSLYFEISELIYFWNSEKYTVVLKSGI